MYLSPCRCIVVPGILIMFIYFLFHKNIALHGKETQAKQLLEKRLFRFAHWGTRRKPVLVP
jgi:hypothetical protein